MTSTAIAARSDRIQRTLEHLRRQSTDTADRLVPFGPGQYADPGLAQRERDLVFGRVPSIVAHIITAEAVTAHCRERLAGYKVPRHVILRDRPLERMASGKIARRQVRAAYPELAAQPEGARV